MAYDFKQGDLTELHRGVVGDVHDWAKALEEHLLLASAGAEAGEDLYQHEIAGVAIGVAGFRLLCLRCVMPL